MRAHTRSLSQHVSRITLPPETRGERARPQWWYMSVLILIMIVPVVAMAVALERYIRRGMLIGAVKG